MNKQIPSQETLKPNPDPTVATNDAVARAAKAERDFVVGQLGVRDTRLDAMDEATRVLSETVTRVPTDVQKEVGHLREVVLEKFASVEQQLRAGEALRLEQKADSKTGLEAALAAQKEAASEQNKSNTLAITKSEAGTVENIKKLEDLFTTKTNAQADITADLKTRVERMESLKQGSQEVVSTNRANIALILSGLLFILSLTGLIITLMLRKP